MDQKFGREARRGGDGETSSEASTRFDTNKKRGGGGDQPANRGFVCAHSVKGRAIYDFKGQGR